MSKRTAMPCWEIIQCNRKNACFCNGELEKPCWDFVREDNACSFHICVDCLVYLANHKQSILSRKQVHSIMRQREKHPAATYPSHAGNCPLAPPTKAGNMQTYIPNEALEMHP